ncbi:MAG: response regulator [Magnetococcales bacterium]|nr:response regulator [Magnetococcales bacterium]
MTFFVYFVRIYVIGYRPLRVINHTHGQFSQVIINSSMPMAFISDNGTYLIRNEPWKTVIEHSGGAEGLRLRQQDLPGNYSIHEWVIKPCMAGRIASGHGNVLQVNSDRMMSYRWQAQPIYGCPGEVSGILISVWRDAVDGLEETVVSVDQSREENEAAHEAKDTFLATMSHEIRTPLHGIVGVTELLSDTRLTPEQKRYTGMIRKSGAALLEILNNILDLSKIEAERLEFEGKDFDLHALLGHLTAMFGELSAQKGVGFRCRIASNVPKYVRGDKTRVRQILMNLLSNAIKFTEHGEVTLSAQMDEERGGWLFLDVNDSGIGLEPEQIGRIFESFTQADGSTTRRFGGSGLGLTISLKLARMMGGAISVRSLPGQGSRFRLLLPVAAPLDYPQFIKGINKEEDVGRLFSGADKRVLIAEDDSISREILVGMLQGLGIVHVDAVTNGKEAVGRVRDGKYDLVFMDCRMPVMDGYEACRVLRQDEEKGDDGAGWRTPVVAITANTMPEDRDRCLEAGMDDLLTKPAKRAALWEVLNRWLGRGRGEKQ